MSSAPTQIGNHTKILERYQQRGFRIFVVSDTDSGARQLAESTQAPGQAQVVSIQELQRRLDAGNRSGIPLFDRPTVLVAPMHVSPIHSVAWQSIRDAARRSPSQVVDMDMPTPSLDQAVNRQPKP